MNASWDGDRVERSTLTHPPEEGEGGPRGPPSLSLADRRQVILSATAAIWPRTSPAGLRRGVDVHIRATCLECGKHGRAQLHASAHPVSARPAQRNCDGPGLPASTRVDVRGVGAPREPAERQAPAHRAGRSRGRHRRGERRACPFDVPLRLRYFLAGREVGRHGRNHIHLPSNLACLVRVRVDVRVCAPGLEGTQNRRVDVRGSTRRALTGAAQRHHDAPLGRASPCGCVLRKPRLSARRRSVARPRWLLSPSK